MRNYKYPEDKRIEPEVSHVQKTLDDENKQVKFWKNIRLEDNEIHKWIEDLEEQEKMGMEPTLDHYISTK